MPEYKCTTQAKVWREGIGVGGEVDSVAVGARVLAKRIGDALYITAGTRNGRIGWSRPGWFQLVDSTTPVPVPTPTPTPVPVGDWKRYQVRHDWLNNSGKNPLSIWRVNVPQVNRIGAFDSPDSQNKVPLNSQRQFFWADLIAYQVFGKAYSVLDAAGKLYVGKRLDAMMGHKLAYTNRPESILVANYVTGENLQQPPANFAALICGGTTVWGKPAGKNKDRIEMVMIYSFLAGEPLPVVTASLLLDARINWGTNISGVEMVSPFPQLRGLSVPVPLITSSQYYYEAGGLEEYDFDEAPRSQYSPPRPYYP